MKPWPRSVLLVPGHKLDWMLKASKCGPDALIFDLEDRYPRMKAQARPITAEGIAKLRDGRQRLCHVGNQFLNEGPSA